MLSQGSLSDCLKLGCAVKRTNSELFLVIIITIFKLLISAPAPLQASTIGPVGDGNEGKMGMWPDSVWFFL